MKYQKGLQWVDLLDKIENEKKSRDLKIQAEIQQVGKLHNFIVGQNMKAQAYLGKKKRIDGKAAKLVRTNEEERDGTNDQVSKTDQVGLGPAKHKKAIFKPQKSSVADIN